VATIVSEVVEPRALVLMQPGKAQVLVRVLVPLLEVTQQ
jgi:hypothetical protein